MARIQFKFQSNIGPHLLASKLAGCKNRTLLSGMLSWGTLRRFTTAATGIVVGLAISAANIDALGDLTSLVKDSSDVALQRDILRGIKAALAGRPRVPAPPGWSDVEANLSRSPNAEVRALAQSLGLTFGSPAAQAALRALAEDKNAPDFNRIEALTSLLLARTPDLVSLLQKLCAEPGLRPTAIRGLAQFDDPETPTVLLKGYSNWAPEHRRLALNTLASRATYAKPLLESVATGRIDKSDLSADLVRQLRNLKNPELNAQLTKVWGVIQERSPDMSAEIERARRRYSAGGSQPGDAGRGRVVFNQICAQCHRLFDSGGQVGPDITGANRSDLDYLLQNILYPNAVVPNEYRQTVIETKDERVLTGVLKSSDGAAYVLQTATELITIPKAEVRKIELLDTSMMPEGLLAGLDDRQMRDLLYYLSRPGQVPLPVGN